MNLSKKIGKNNENLQTILDVYKEDIDAAPARLAIKGKTLGEANKEHVAWLVYYDQCRVELRALAKHMHARMERVRGELYQKYTDKCSVALSERGKDKYIDKDDAFLDANDAYLEVDEVYEKFCAIVEAFKARGFALRNLVELQVHQMLDTPV